MKIKTTHSIILILSILLISAFVYGQYRDPVHEKKYVENLILHEKIEQSASVSDATQDLRRKLGGNNVKGIIEAVKSCDTSFIPLLELFTQIKGSYADVALVRMGKTEYLKPLIDQTLLSEDWDVRYTAIKKLALTENKLAYKRLYELLDDTKTYKSDSDEVFSTMPQIVMSELSEIVSNPPNLKSVYETDKRILLWKKWFEEHKELTEGTETPKCNVVTPTPKPIVSKTDNSFVNDILFTDYLSIVLLNKLF
jgi:hypothetical protein